MEEIGRGITEWQNEVQAFDEAFAERMGLNLTDVRCLGLLINRGAMSAGELAQASGLSPGAMTAAVDRWEKAGYARRVRSSEDRRSVSVEPTAKVRRASEELWGPLVVEGREVLRRYSAEELELIRDFVSQCVALQVRHTARVRGRPVPSASEAPERPGSSEPSGEEARPRSRSPRRKS
ncbi:MarR family winged helix-turn-helix transcriptional regulator [Vitiosangium sp. GDMCC 1.1324]|uniref:MarR family winged helix-turn-helix transcriptional regulator n=1 Tax=Vitiosangium sp. (strain GDMCC 1.1324) TaxID=2138576 RepID=UPI00130E943D|nr:MarR family transcriptional regulator [Vitiosangium sp. GDMCC 1.1324]